MAFLETKLLMESKLLKALEKASTGGLMRLLLHLRYLKI